MIKTHLHSLKLFLVAVVFAAAPFLDTLTVNAANGPELGISTGNTLLNLPDADLQKRLLDMKNLGAKWIRVDFSWAVIQPVDYLKFDFRFHDKVVIAAENMGLKVFATLTYTPKWARNLKCAAIVEKNEEAQQKCTPRDSKEFARFAYETAFHYRYHGVLGWEIWNEPNLTGYHKYPREDGTIWVNPSAMARLSTAAAQRIHQIKPYAIVITGGMAPVYEATDKRGMRQGDYLREMLPHLTKGGITGIGIHPYTWPAYPHDKADWNAFHTVDNGSLTYNLRAILRNAGRDDLEIWGTEYGASTVTTTPGGRDAVSEPAQAQMIKEGVEGWYVKPRVGPLFIYVDSDQYIVRQVRNEGGFGIRRRDGTPKPAHAALQQSFSATRAAWQNRTSP